MVVHHVGLSGLAFLKFPYKFLTSFRKNYGAKGGTTEPNNTIISTYANIGLMRNYFDLNVIFGADFSTEGSPSMAFGIKLEKRFF